VIVPAHVVPVCCQPHPGWEAHALCAASWLHGVSVPVQDDVLPDHEQPLCA
jgi:hypothetical protein